MSGPDEPSEAEVLQAAAVTTALRAWLQARRAHPDMVLAGAMAYELCAIIARNAGTKSNALALIDVWAEVMRDQVRQLGVETEHP